MRFSIGIPIHNEGRNIGRLLGQLRARRLEALGLRRVIVVSSGSTDGSDEAVERLARTWPALELLRQAERRGKADAVNLFLAAVGDDPDERLVLISGDVLPAPAALPRLLAALDDPAVGMAGGQPRPCAPPTRAAERIAAMLWELHHLTGLRRPKLGEAVAFRNIVRRIPADTAVDEAALEAAIVARGYRLAYVPEAEIRNRAPATLADLLRQRRRIAAGHLHLRRTTGYAVSTLAARDAAPVLLRALAADPRRAPRLLAAAGIELASRALGRWDLLRGRNPYVWPMAATTKEPVPARRSRLSPGEAR